MSILKPLGVFICILFSISNIYSNSELLADAKLLAEKSGKNIFVNYTADWCLPCQIFKDQVLNDTKVSNLLDSDFIVVKSDYDNVDSKQMFDDYAIACMPTLHILDKNGEVLNELSGTMTAQQFYEEISMYALPKSNENIVATKTEIVKKPKKVISEFLTLQAGAFSSWDNAIRQKQKIGGLITEPIIIVQDTERDLYIINVGKYSSNNDLLPVSQQLKDASIAHFVKRKREINVLLDKGI